MREAIDEVWNTATRMARSMFAQAENLMGTHPVGTGAAMIDFQMAFDGEASCVSYGPTSELWGDEIPAEIAAGHVAAPRLLRNFGNLRTAMDT